MTGTAEASSEATIIGEHDSARIARGIIVATAAVLAGAEPSMAKQRDEDIDIKRSESRPSTKGSAEWFTEAVRVDPIFHAPDPARAGGAHVTFEPGARTAWHTHPLGQTLIITSGFKC